MKKWLVIVVAIGVFIGVFSELVNGSEEKKEPMPVHILAGIDSLTNGRLNGTTKSRYLDDFIPAVQKKYGDGGPGYVPFDTRYFNQEGGRLIYTPNLREINNIPHTMYPATYSFDFKGLYTNFGRSDSIKVRFNHSWTYGKLFYLKQLGGGTFKVGYSNDRTLRVSTGGRPGLGVVELPIHDKDQPLFIKNIHGRVALFGGYFYNPTGVVVSRVGQGGDRLEWFAGLNQNQQREWIRVLKPDLFIFNGGMNDRHHLSAEQYETALEKYLSPFRKAHCSIIVSIPNAIHGDQRRLNQYADQLRLYSNKYHTGLFSYKDVLGGSFEEANKKGYMGDYIHPSAKGAKQISEHLLNYIYEQKNVQQVLLKQ